MTCDSVMMVEGGELHLRSAGGTTELVWCVGLTPAHSRQRNLQEYLQAPGGHLHPDASWTGTALQNRSLSFLLLLLKPFYFLLH